MIRKCNVFVALNRNKKLQKIYSTKKFLSYINTYFAWKKQQKNKKGSQLPSEVRNSKPEISLSTLFHIAMCFAKNLRDKYGQRLIYEDFHIFLFLNSFYFYLTNLDFLDLWVYTASLNVRAGNLPLGKIPRKCPRKFRENSERMSVSEMSALEPNFDVYKKKHHFRIFS